MVDQYETGDQPVTLTYNRWLVTLPDVNEITWAFVGALAYLGFNSTWKTVGTMTGDEAAQFFKHAYRGLRKMNFSIGMVIPHLADVVPDDCLIADGSTHARDDYPELWEALPAAMKTPTTLTLPDLRDQFILASGVTLPFSQGGESEVTLVESEMPTHNHTQNPHAHSETSLTSVPTAAGLEPALASLVTVVPASTGFSTATNNAAGGGLPHNNMPPYYALRYLVVAK